MLCMMKMDWFAIKYYHKRLFLIPVFLILTGISSSIYLIPLSVFLFFSYSLNPFAAEEKGDLNRFYLTLPVQRKSIVRGRYALSLLLFLCGFLLGFILMPPVNLISNSKWYPDLRWVFLLFTSAFFIYALMNLSMYPLLFKLGYQKGKFWGLYLPFSFFSILLIFFTLFLNIPGNEMFLFNVFVFVSKAENMLKVNGGILICAFIFLLISYLISVKIYEKREF